MSVPKLAYTVAEAAAATGFSTSHLKREIAAGKLRTRTTKLNADDEPVGRRLILARELDAYLDGLADALIASQRRQDWTDSGDAVDVCVKCGALRYVIDEDASED